MQRNFGFLQSSLILTMFLILAPGKSWGFGLWLEPYAGYEMGNVEQGNTSNDFSGENLGFRLGGTNDQLFFGFEYALSTLDVEKTGADDELKAKDMGLFVGYQFAPVRLWATLWFSNEADSDLQNGTYEGESGYKLGLGFKVFDPISLNVEKTLRYHKELEGNDLTNKVEVDGLLISFSLPFSM
jgi:hypothetical protein